MFVVIVKIKVFKIYFHKNEYNITFINMKILHSQIFYFTLKSEIVNIQNLQERFDFYSNTANKQLLQAKYIYITFQINCLKVIC